MIESPEGGPKLDPRDIYDRLEGSGRESRKLHSITLTVSLNGHQPSDPDFHAPSDPFELEDRLEGLSRPPSLTRQNRGVRAFIGRAYRDILYRVIK